MDLNEQPADGSSEASPADNPAETSSADFADWLATPHLSVGSTKDPVLCFLLRAVYEKREVEFTYLGGTKPGQRRRVRPLELFRLSDYGSSYLTGFCALRQANRTFRVDNLWIAGVGPAPPTAANSKARTKPAPKVALQTLRKQWDTELHMPFPLLAWTDFERFLQAHEETMLWFLAQWDGTARMNLAALQSLGEEYFTGLPFAALDMDEAFAEQNDLVRRLALPATNNFLLFSAGREIWREQGPGDATEFRKWFKALRRSARNQPVSRPPSATPQRAAYRPTKLHFAISGCPWPWDKVVWDGKVLVVQQEKAPPCFQRAKPTRCNPSPEQWGAFWAVVEQARVWHWVPNYWRAVLDGTYWTLHLSHAGRTVRCHGSNAYPGSMEPAYAPNTPFAEFQDALYRLAGIPPNEGHR